MNLTEPQDRALRHARDVLTQVPENPMALRLALRDILAAFSEVIELSTACRTERHPLCGGYRCPCNCHFEPDADPRPPGAPAFEADLS